VQATSDRGALASTLKTWGLSAAELKQAVEAIDSKVKSFEQIGTMEESKTVVERVQLQRDGMQITLNLGAMLRLDQLPTGAATLRMTRLVPMQMRRRGVETRFGDSRRDGRSVPDGSCSASSIGSGASVVF
jgi:hypothetical protein